MSYTKNILKRKGLFAILLLLQFFSFSCKKEKQSEEDSKNMTVVTTMKFYSYDGQTYTSGPHYYNPYILNNLGVPNSVILINGHNFSQDFKKSSVLFNDLSAPAIRGDSTTIYVMIPDQVPPGPVILTIKTNGKSIVHPTHFTVEAPVPQITGLNVPAGMHGSRVIISGLNFSTNAAKTSVTINGTVAAIDSLTLSAVYFKVPAKATSGKIVLTTFGKTLTYPADFTVTSSIFTKISDIGLGFMSLDAAGNFYGTAGNMIYKITPDGVPAVLAKIGSDNNYLGHTGTVFGGCIADASGAVYFTSPYEVHPADIPSYPDFTLKLIKVLPDGSLSTIAGGKNYPAYIDGQGTQAGFYMPFDLAQDALTGNFYINDGSVIRKVTSSGLVSTVANARDNIGPVTIPGFNGVSTMTVQLATGDVYLASVGINSSNVAKITSGGVISTAQLSGEKILFDSQNAYFNKCSLALNASGTIFLSLANSLYQIKNGVVTNTYANPVGGNIIGLAVDKSGNLYLSAAEAASRYDYDTKYSLYKVVL